MRFVLALLVLALPLVHRAAAAPPAGIRHEIVEYRDGDTVLEGLLVYDAGQRGPRPGILVFHAWGGPSDKERKRAEQLAGLGYAAFVADVYGKGVRPQTMSERAAEAGKYRSGTDRSLARSRARAALGALSAQDVVAPSRIAAIGYCFGGMIALELARDGADIAGVVSFHGTLSTPNPADAQRIRAKVLVLHGADDPHVPDTEVLAFQKEMREAGVDWQFIAYGGAVHAFTDPGAGDDPTRGSAYHRRSDLRSWQAMRQFFGELFR